MAKLKKFLFDIDFEKKEMDTKVSPQTEPTLNPDEIPIFSRLEVNKYKEEHEKIGFDNGFKKGKEEALNDINKELLTLISTLIEKFNKIEEKNNERLRNINKDSISISLEIAKKLSSAYSKIRPEENVLSFIKEIFDKYKNVLLKEKIKIYVNEAILDVINISLKENSLDLSKSENFELIGDNNLNINDSKIDWQSGGIDKYHNELEREINNKINNFITNLERELKGVPDKEDKNDSSRKDIKREETDSIPTEQSEIKEEKKNEDDIKTVGGSKSVKYE